MGIVILFVNYAIKGFMIFFFSKPVFLFNLKFFVFFFQSLILYDRNNAFVTMTICFNFDG